MPQQILVTGATGFVGAHLVETLCNSGHKVVSAVRNCFSQDVSDTICVGDINGDTDWSGALTHTDVVIHCAARAHVMDDDPRNSYAQYAEVNVAGTEQLVKAAIRAGVKRFIYLSSIKVNGESTPFDKPFTHLDAQLPEDDYGRSKAAAELVIATLCAESTMDFVIIRPPLVYGVGVKGNFASLVSAVQRGVPLPLGAIHNRRSLVAIDNLCDLILKCIDHTKAENQTFLASDNDDISTTELLQLLKNAVGSRSILVPIPGKLIRLVATLLGRKSAADRLLGSLVVDSSHAQECLGWEPRLKTKDALIKYFSK